MDPKDSTERAARTATQLQPNRLVLSNQENRRLDSKMKVEDLDNESNEMRVPQDLTGLAALSLFDQNRN